MIFKSGMNQLIADLGNTYKKFAVFDGNGNIKELVSAVDFNAVSLKRLISRHAINSVIISSVIDNIEQLYQSIPSHCRILKFNTLTPVPIKILYQSLPTLGPDRLAAAVAGYKLFPDRNVLVVDAGTCIKYDFVTSAGEYPGGSISPGLKMRFKALHTFTDKLPLIEVENIEELTGRNTNESLLTGVMNGSKAEMEGIINHYREKYRDVQVVLSGGDMQYFVPTLKNQIFALENIVLHGLKYILDYNDNKT